MVTRKKKATKKRAPLGRSKGRTKKRSRKSLLLSLVKKPMNELVKKGGLISEAITIKVQKKLRKRGEFIGPTAPTRKERAQSARAHKAAVKARRLENLAMARAKRFGFIGPVEGEQTKAQRQLLRDAGII